MLGKLTRKLKKELETPRAEYWFGSGWLSGSGALLCGLVSVVLAIALKYPWLTTPELAVVTKTAAFKLFQHAVLLLGYAFSLISLLLRRDKTLGFCALALTIAAALMGGSANEQQAIQSTSIYFGLDFFVLNLLFTGLLFVPIERFFPHDREQTTFRREWQEDLFYYMVSSLFVQVLAFLTLSPAQIVNTTAPLQPVQTYIGAQPFLIQLLLIMLFTDFVQYWLHRAFHHFPRLWRFHAVHHSAKTMDWLAGARMHFIEIIVLRATTAIPMFTMGFDPNAIQTYILIVYVYSAFVHANVGWDLSRVERFIVTPRFHHWHHGSEKEAIDVNYAIHFPLLDWLFGTHLAAGDRWPEKYGIVGAPMPRGYWPQFLYPFQSPKTFQLTVLQNSPEPSGGPVVEPR
jgi:sterol desaturase/sphingolipid hydroxylase (fatty acid hydroxylase superfamily)